MNIIYVMFALIIVSIVVGLLWINLADTHIVRVKKHQIMEFKSSFDLTGLPIIVFYQGDRKYNFLIDSGSNLSYVDQNSHIEMQMTNNKDVFMGANGTDMSCQYAHLKLYRDTLEYQTVVAVADLGQAFAELKSSYGVTLTGIIGCDFMNKYSYCLDFKELVVYARK